MSVGEGRRAPGERAGRGVFRMSKVAVGPEPQVSVRPSPAVIQSLAILQMSAPELAQALCQEVVDNPCLEWNDAEPRWDSAVWEQAPDGGQELTWAEGAAADEPVGLWAGPAASSPHLVAAQDSQALLRSTTTRYEELLGQLRLMELPSRVAQVAEYIVGCLDPDGYLRVSLSSIAAECSVGETTVLRALEAVQSLEPPGIGARTLEECLELQLRARGLAEPELIDSLRACVAALRHEAARGDLTDVPLALPALPERLRAVLRSLDPRPGLRLGVAEPPPCELPDLLVLDVGGQLICEVARYPEHAVRVSGYYREMYQKARWLDPPVREFLKTRLTRATRFVRAVESRRATLLRVGQFLVERQQRAFTEGLGALRPLSLSEAAGALQLHVSTLSRAVKGKYLWSARLGTVPLRTLFPAPLKLPHRCAAEGQPGRVSHPTRLEILEHVRRLAVTRGEEGKRPSDGRIAQALAQLGIPLSRRTVAKYRRSLGIPAVRGC